MTKFFWSICQASPVILGTSLLIANHSWANTNSSLKTQNDLPTLETLITDATLVESDSTSNNLWQQINQYNNEGTSLDQVTNVNQLRDVSPRDWAYEALRNLVETYGCIAGYPDGTYRGNRAMTRYEFAAGLNACLQQIERLIAASTADFVTKDDLAILQRLMEEFEAELATLGTRVDNLEGRVAFLEDHQFSTTTKLKGEVIFSLNNAFGDEAVGGGEIDDQTTFSNRVRLNFDTSFTGKDRLRTRLQMGNIPRLNNATGTDMARLGYDANNGNNVEIHSLWYRFPINDSIRGYIGTASLDLSDIADVYNPFFASSGTGGLNRFSRRNPAVYRLNEGSAAGLNIAFSDAISLDLAYLTDSDEGNNPADGSGFFNGDNNYAVQLNLEPSDDIGIGLTYVYSHLTAGNINLSGSTGSSIAKRPFGNGNAMRAHRFGVQANWRVSEGINIGGWGGYINAEALEGANDGDSADIWNWLAHVAFPDVGGEGNVLGFIVGMPPKATDVENGEDDEDTSILLEAQYKWKISKNIQITPGVYVIFNPDHNDDNDTIYVGTIRTTFKF